MPRHTQLADWLAWQETLHPQAIDLGLARVGAVLQRLKIRPTVPIYTVAGTNGKGSCVALLDAMLRAQGYRVGCFTSPHLLRYNERISLNGTPVSDAALCAAFAAIDAARAEISLSYFEFNTLAAFWIFQATALDAWVLEVGLGGRLDAVNTVAADVAVLATLDLDHQAWLGETREAIGREKAGILRAGRPVVCADRQPPASVRAEAARLGAPLAVLGENFTYQRQADGRWHWQMAQQVWHDLPPPALAGDYQYDNAATALAALLALHRQLPVDVAAIAQGLQTVSLPGRWQRLRDRVWLDVAHNPQALQSLARLLHHLPVAGQTRLVVGMMQDKAWQVALLPLLAEVTHWHAVDLPTPRALAAADLAAWLQAQGAVVQTHAAAELACAAAYAATTAADRVVVCGSFWTVAAALRWAEHGL